MGSDAIFLVFDTSAAHCAAAVFRDDVMLSGTVVPMARGQAEALVPLLERMMAEAGSALDGVTALGVGIGPGNFTGTRIAVATARGLSLALGRPAIGISSFELMRDPEDGLAAHPAEIVSVEAPRGQAYVQHFRYGAARAVPRLIDPADPPEDLRLPVNLRVVGYRAREIAERFGAEHKEAAPRDVPLRLGKVTECKWRTGAWSGRPAPLYVRPPDAAAPADAPPAILP